MHSSSRHIWVCTSTLALLSVVACDPKLAGPEEQHLEDTDADEDGDGHSSDPGDDAGSAEGESTVGTGHDCDEDDRTNCAPADPLPPPGEVHAFAIHWGDVPELHFGESDSGGSGGEHGPGPLEDPESILVVIGNTAASCENPWASSGCGSWTISFTLPADVVPGNYALVDLNGFQSVSGTADGGDECWGGGGSLEGTLVLEAIDDTSIVAHIEDSVAFEIDANVAIAATFCP